MLLEMICTGEEVLSGQIVDTNAAWFADTMLNLGIELQQRTTVGDRMQDLVRIFTERSLHADVILVNGGLGPTSDDLSAEAMAQAAGVPLLENQEWRTHLQDWFTRRGRTMPASNLKQCLLPENAILIDNPVGSAPGFRIKLNRAWLFFTPGVPSEFKHMVTEQFVPFVRGAFKEEQATRLYKFLTFGHGESSLADQLSQLPVPSGITLGYRTSAPHVEIKVFARGDAAIAAMGEYLQLLRVTLGTAVVSERFASIAEEVHHLLLDVGQTLAMAESCTGGMLASQLVEYPGSSAYLHQSLVTYSNDAKTTALGVSPETLLTHGAVSKETVVAMAKGVRELLNSDYSLATSGIAGPEGGSVDKPVGTVAIALCDREHCWVQLVSLGQQRSRTMIRMMSCAVALDMLRRKLLDASPLVNYPFIPATATYVEQIH
ncbi:MAG: CinA family nicotinamide mononucleotide deamidase-related protein [Pseudomonadota bacterium]